MRTWAIIVGINEYPDAAGQRVLKGAVADALDFADWALHPDGGNVEPSRLFLWTHPAPAPTAATPAVAACLAAPSPWWGQTVPPVRPDRPPSMMEILQTAYQAAQEAHALALEDGEESRCYILLAGHGVQARIINSSDMQTCFLAGDFQSNGIITGLLPSIGFRDGLLMHGFTEVFLFLDCCRLDLTIYNALVAPLPFPAGQAPSKPRWGTGLAADPDSIAWETPPADPMRGAFTQLLVEGLRLARNADDNSLTLQQLDDYVSVRIDAAVAPNKQSPFIFGPKNARNILVVQTPPIPLSEPLATAPVVVNCSGVPRGAVLRMLDRNDQEVARFKSNGATVTQYARVGALYSIASADGQFEKEFMHAGQGDTHVDL